MNQQSRVVISGMGLSTPLGNTVTKNWESLLAARSGITSPSLFDFGGHTAQALGVVANETELLNNIFPLQKQRKTERFMHLAVIAAHQAMLDAGFSMEEPIDRTRCGVYLGIGIGGLHAISEGTLSFAEHGKRSVSPFLIPRSISSEAASWLSMEWNLQGPMGTFCNACASSADAIGVAWNMIRHGYADMMLAGGSESCLTPLAFAGFANMRALSTWQGDPTQASRPFAQDRSGFVMAEGAGMLVLERADHAFARGAPIYAEIVGYGSHSDAYHVTAIHPEGRGATLAMRMALNDAKIDPSEIGYINAHGTGTPLNDPVETHVIKKIFGAHVARDNPNRGVISSTKSMTGHMLGAAGSVELSYAALALKHQIVPPTINLTTPDSLCDLDYVPNVARAVPLKYAMSNAFGFGGGNTVLILKAV